MDLVEFLRARLNDDESAARATAYSSASAIEDSWSVRQKDRRDDMSWALYSQGKYLKATELHEADARHMARYAPARVLAEVRAKRQIVKDCAFWLTEDDQGPNPLAEQTLRLLALPFADHPDYDPAWRTQSTNLV